MSGHQGVDVAALEIRDVQKARTDKQGICMITYSVWSVFTLATYSVWSVFT